MIISLSPHRVSPFSRGVIFTLARVSLALLSLRKKWRTTCSLAQCHPTVWLQIIFCSCVMETVLFSFLRSLLRENGRSLRFPKIFIKKNKLGDRMIKQLLYPVIAKYRDLSVSCRSIICLSLRLQQIIDLLATDKSRYFAQPRPIIVNYFTEIYHKNQSHN